MGGAQVPPAPRHGCDLETSLVASLLAAVPTQRDQAGAAHLAGGSGERGGGASPCAASRRSFSTPLLVQKPHEIRSAAAGKSRGGREGSCQPALPYLWTAGMLLKSWSLTNCLPFFLSFFYASERSLALPAKIVSPSCRCHLSHFSPFSAVCSLLSPLQGLLAITRGRTGTLTAPMQAQCSQAHPGWELAPSVRLSSSKDSALSRAIFVTLISKCLSFFPRVLLYFSVSWG